MSESPQTVPPDEFPSVNSVIDGVEKIFADHRKSPLYWPNIVARPYLDVLNRFRNNHRKSLNLLRVGVLTVPFVLAGNKIIDYLQTDSIRDQTQRESYSQCAPILPVQVALNNFGIHPKPTEQEDQIDFMPLSNTIYRKNLLAQYPGNEGSLKILDQAQGCSIIAHYDGDKAVGDRPWNDAIIAFIAGLATIPGQFLLYRKFIAPFNRKQPQVKHSA